MNANPCQHISWGFKAMNCSLALGSFPWGGKAQQVSLFTLCDSWPFTPFASLAAFLQAERAAATSSSPDLSAFLGIRGRECALKEKRVSFKCVFWHFVWVLKALRAKMMLWAKVLAAHVHAT